LKCIPKAVKKYIQEVNKLRYEQKNKANPPRNQAEERFLLPMSTEMYEQTLGDWIRDYDSLLSLEQHNIYIGRNTLDDDPSIDSSESSDNIWDQNIDTRTGARLKNTGLDEDEQTSDETYQDQIGDPGQVTERSDSSPSQVQKKLFKDTTTMNPRDEEDRKQADVLQTHIDFLSKQMNESKVAELKNW
jgi:hypothetical protein